MNFKSRISLLVTGGTLDKNYNEISGKLSFNTSHLDEVLNEANTTLKIDTKVLMLKDSLEMTHYDRDVILNACQTQPHQHIVITHGTDTMVETALYLVENSNNFKGKAIVLTGAMRPFKLGHSDASFNIGSAIMAVQLASPGVYIAMNGHLFHAEDAMKNKPLGVFQSTSEKL